MISVMHAIGISFRGLYFLQCNRPLTRYSCSAKVWSNTRIQHTTGKNKPSLVSAPIFRVTDHEVECHQFENCNFYKVLYGEQARLARSAHLPHKTLYNFQIDGALWYFGVWVWQFVHLLLWFAFSSGVFCFCVWPSIIGAVLWKAYNALFISY